jgi:dGTPase
MENTNNKQETKPLYDACDYTRELSLRQEQEYRSEFRRDYARLVHSPAFRRLQGKTQLFPGIESDFFRNRLTHSLEVAQVAKSIALKLNATDAYFSQHNINTDLVETAALAHDLGHPPFGHNGEYALDECMRDFGGFEGNAQTLRVVTKLSKKEFLEATGTSVGLNFTYRTIGALLKYDKAIPILNQEREAKDKLVKGYYKSNEPLISNAKRLMLKGGEFKGKFKTIECNIMDIADDIAYSTYDLEDAMKAGFVTPLEILSYAHKESFLEKIAGKVKDGTGIALSAEEVHNIYLFTFGGFIVQELKGADLADGVDLVKRVVSIYGSSKRAASEGQLRTAFTSELVNEFLGGVSADVNKEFPVLSIIKMDPEIHAKIEVLKHFTFEAMIMSPRLKIVEYRGREIVESIFNALTEDDGYLLLPDDCRAIYEALDDEAERKRLVCDFIAGMTDRYAIEFYGRLKSTDNGMSFFKPL